MHILPIASGKGGVGKSLISSNLAIALGQAGKKVVLADLDLGGSNLHLMLGIRSIPHGLGPFLNDQDIKFEDIIMKTEYENLFFIPGDAEIPGIANLKSQQKQKLIRKLKAIEADFLILDLGAGTGYNVMDFFLTSGQGIIVTTPNLTATVNAYLFIKNAIFRVLYSTFHRKSRAYAILEEMRKRGSALQKIYIPQLLDKIRKEDKENYGSFQESISRFHPRLILNMLEEPKDTEKVGKLRRSSREYLDLDVEHLGVIYRDNMQDVALSSRIPMVIYKPNSVLSQAVYRIADKLVQYETDDEGPINLEDLENTYQAAEMEAEIDYNSKMDYIEELLHTGALSTGDLIETIKSQQFEISQLKKQNNLYKKKLIKASEQGYKI